MFLKSLEIKGFKSFADPVLIEFEPGITVIVGPNGSGKSNIVDAMCWVMGTQAVSAMRTGTMQEVIFAGSTSRKPLGRAKVTVIFDNSDRTLPLDLSEVAISRTLYRNGESEYAINGTPCRLLDVQELLSDTGVGKQMHSIVGQGQLESVLTASPEDRRAMVEEAAGVLKYKRRKERALRRLAATEENLARLHDVIKEVERQMRPLRRQAAAVERYRELRAEVASLRKLLAFRKWASARDSLTRAEEDLNEARIAVGRLESLLESLRSEEQEVTESLERVASAWSRAEEAVSRIAELRRVGGGIGDIAREKKKFFQAVALKSAAQHLDLIGAEKEQLDLRVAEIEASLPALREELEEAMEEEQRLAGELESLREWIGGGAAAVKAAELAGERSSLESAIARGEIEVSQLVERRRTLEQRKEALEAERRRLDEEIRRLDAQAGPLGDAVEALSGRLAAARRDVSELERRREDAADELAMWNGRLEALKNLAARLASEEGAGRVLEAAPHGVVGALWNLIDVERGAELAVEAALGELSRAVVVEGREALEASAAVLSEDESGTAWVVDASSLAEGGMRARLKGSPVESVPARSEATPLVTFVTVKEPGARVEEVLRLLLARFYLAPDFESAAELAGRFPELTFVTAEGCLAGAGVYRVGKPAPGPYGELANLTEVAARARDCETRLRTVSRELERRRNDVAELESELAAAQAGLQECDAMLTAAAGELGRIDPELERVRAEREALEKAEAKLVSRIGEDRARLDEIETFLAEVRAGIGDASNGHGELGDGGDGEARLQALQEALSAARQRRSEAEKALAGAEERHVVLASRRDQLASRLEEERARLAEEERRRRRAVECARLAEEVEEAVALLLGEISAMEEEAEDLEAALRPLAEVWRQKEAGVRKRLETCADQLARSRELLREAELDQVRARTVLDQVEEEYRAAAGEEPPRGEVDAETLGIEPELFEADDETAAAQLRALERELERMGPINQLALEDYEQAASRLKFLNEQAGDLEGSRAELEKVVSAIDEKIAALFRSAFNDVAEAFEETFGTLFPGGNGRLFLQDPSSPLTSGVEVEAKPSGKSVKRLSLLSGGERSLAALAFLFALYRARPSPFYVLDEVEAALDDINLERFLRLLASFRDHGQMVVITHQKRTVEIADSLYGVSMQRDGASRVFSYKVSEALSYT